MSKMSLDQVVNSGKALPDRIVLYGPSGWGKTSLAAQMPSPIVLMTQGEDRLLKMIERRLLPPTDHFKNIAETWSDVVEAIKTLRNSTHSYKTLILDTGNGVEQLAMKQICNENFHGDWSESGFNSFGRGEKITANTLWAPLLASLDELRRDRNMRIVLCCHATVRSVKNPEGIDFDRIEPALSKQSWSLTARWSDMILCGSVEMRVSKENKIAHAKATGGQNRLLHTCPSASIEAKNCHRLPPIIRLGNDPGRCYTNFVDAFQHSQKQPAAANDRKDSDSLPGNEKSPSPSRDRTAPSDAEAEPFDVVVAKLGQAWERAGYCSSKRVEQEIKSFGLENRFPAALAEWSPTMKAEARKFTRLLLDQLKAPADDETMARIVALREQLAWTESDLADKLAAAGFVQHGEIINEYRAVLVIAHLERQLSIGGPAPQVAPDRNSSEDCEDSCQECSEDPELEEVTF